MHVFELIADKEYKVSQHIMDIKLHIESNIKHDNLYLILLIEKITKLTMAMDILLDDIIKSKSFKIIYNLYNSDKSKHRIKEDKLQIIKLKYLCIIYIIYK